MSNKDDPSVRFIQKRIIGVLKITSKTNNEILTKTEGKKTTFMTEKSDRLVEALSFHNDKLFIFTKSWKHLIATEKKHYLQRVKH